MLGALSDLDSLSLMERLARLFAVLWFLLGLAACMPQAKYPLSDASQASVDTRLVGLWSSRFGDEDVFAHVLPRDDGLTDIVSVSYRRGDTAGDWIVFRMFPTHIGGRDYMNLRLVANADDDDLPQRYFLFRYSFSSDGALTVWGVPNEAAAAAIGKGLRGTVNEGQWDDEIVIEASSEELAAYLLTADADDLFDGRIGVFRRVE